MFSNWNERREKGGRKIIWRRRGKGTALFSISPGLSSKIIIILMIHLFILSKIIGYTHTFSLPNTNLPMNCFPVMFRNWEMMSIFIHLIHFWKEYSTTLIHTHTQSHTGSHQCLKKKKRVLWINWKDLLNRLRRNPRGKHHSHSINKNTFCLWQT